MKLLRFDFKLNSDYCKEIYNFLTYKSDIMKNFEKDIQVKVDDVVYGVKLTIDIYDDDPVREIVLNIRLSKDGDYDYMPEVISEYDKLFNIYKYDLNENIKYLISIDEDREINFSKCFDDYTDMYKKIINQNGYLEKLVMKKSLADKVEKFQFIIGCFISKLYLRDIGDKELVEFIKDKLSFYGYDYSFAKENEFYLNPVDSEGIFEKFTALLLFILNGDEIDINYYKDLPSIYKSYLSALTKEDFFKGKSKRHWRKKESLIDESIRISTHGYNK